MIGSLLTTLNFITTHPLNRNQKISALSRWVDWQIRSRISRDPLVIPFVNHSKLLVSRGMTGATGNVYCGLHEFEDMAFLLHLLRVEDLFIDVGANVGSYTVLAAAVIGAKCISIEPIPATFKPLTENIRLNAISERVTALNIGVAAQPGKLKFTSGSDTTNHVISQKEKVTDGIIEVEVDTLDHLAGHLNPALLKIDVEGFEANVIEGADQVLRRDSILALIVERNKGQNRYGYQGNYLQERLQDNGFAPHRYDPFQRTLLAFDQNAAASNNVLYLKNKNLTLIKERFFTAPPFFVKRIRKEGI